MRSWRDVRNLLCIRLDGLGDIVMTTPALRAFRASLPQARITLLCSSAGWPVANLIPSIDAAIRYDPPWMKATPARVDFVEDRRMIETLRQQHFDAAAIFTVYSQNPLPAALMVALADIPLRLATCRENPYQLLTNWVKETEPENGIRHEVRRHLDLAASVGCVADDDRLDVAFSSSAKDHARHLLHVMGINPDQPWIAVHPGASAPSRRYPEEHFSQTVSYLAKRLKCPIAFTGAADEVDLIDRIRARSGVPAASFAGRLDLETLCAVISLASVFITNNTGPAHIAAAVGTPVVDLYALTNPQHTPWRVPSRVLNHDVPCKYCYKSVCPEGHNNCLRLVTPERVAAETVDLFQETFLKTGEIPCSRSA